MRTTAASRRVMRDRLFPIYGPAEQQSEERAVRVAKSLATKHVGVIAWSRKVNPAIGECGPRPRFFRRAKCWIWRSDGAGLVTLFLDLGGTAATSSIINLTGRYANELC